MDYSSDTREAAGVTASGEVYLLAGYKSAHWHPLSTIGAGTDFVSIEHFPQHSDPYDPCLFCVMTACGDVYQSTRLSGPWTYKGNVFGNPPSPAEMETWGELKGEFRE